MTAPAFHFEAKKYALRQAKDGVIVSFVVHPSDVVADLLSAPIGEHYVVALAPYEKAAEQAEQQPEAPAPPPEKVKEPVPFRHKPRSQQAAIRINDPEFRKWWNAGPDTSAEHVNADLKRECGVTSKRELNTDRNAAETWSRIEEAYSAWRKANRPVETEERA